MKAQGFQQDFDLDIDQLDDKAFHTFRKSRTNMSNGANHYKWNPFNLVNKGFMTNSDYVLDEMNDASLAKSIYQSRPDLILNIGNEYLTMQMMEQVKHFYDRSALNMPKRHLYTRFVRDFKEFTLPFLDYCHYTVPLNTANNNGFVFPSEYVG